jgi:hypothetical protein
MMAGRKPADVRFYFDADVLGVAKVIAQLRSDCTFPGDPGATIHKRTRPPCVVQDRATPDTVWLPTVSAAGWVIITRDSRIGHNLAELDAVRDAGARMVALSGKEAGTTGEQLEIVVSRWRSIEALHAMPGPFIFRSGRSGMAAQKARLTDRSARRRGYLGSRPTRLPVGPSPSSRNFPIHYPTAPPGTGKMAQASRF